MVAILCGVHLLVPNQAFRWTAFIRIRPMTSTASLFLQSFFVLTHARISPIRCFSGQGLDPGPRLKNVSVNASELFLEYQCPQTRCTPVAQPLLRGDLTRLRYFRESARSSSSMATRLRFMQKRCSKLFLSRSISLSWRWLPMNFQRKYFVRKSYHCCVSSPWICSSSTLSINCSVSRFFETVGVTQWRLSSSHLFSSPHLLIAQLPKAVMSTAISLDRHCDQASASRPLAPTAEFAEVLECPHLPCLRRFGSWAGMQMDQAPAPEPSCFPLNVISRTAR
jgi:hypothetical protein